MAFDWFINIIKKAAAEVHKTKISEFEERLLKIEQKQEVILKSIRDQDNTLEKLDKRIYDSNIQSAKAVGTIDAIIQTGYIKNHLLIQDKTDDNNTDKE